MSVFFIWEFLLHVSGKIFFFSWVVNLLIFDLQHLFLCEEKWKLCLVIYIANTIYQKYHWISLVIFPM